MLCASCLASLRPVPQPLCGRCGAPTVWPVGRCRECAGRRLAFASARAAALYAGPARTLLRAWKEHGHRHAGSLAAQLVTTRIPPATVDIVTHVPPDRVRQLERGRHPAEELAARVAANWGLEHARLLRRRAGSRRQTGLARSQRGTNVAGVFTAPGPAPARVLLVDDVYTTGATASAAAAALRTAGADIVEVVTFARTLR